MNGFIVINKPLRYTSRDVVNIIGKKLHTKKIGHTGTLDPNASGVLVVAIGNALKTIELMDDFDKEYIAEIILGIETDTLDMDTNATIIREENVNIDRDTINDFVISFKGKYQQTVPKYSAVKVNGKKLYEYARSNIPVELPQKEVEIKNIEIINDITYRDNKIFFKIKCTVSKGTYIRALIRDIGEKLNSPAVMNSLVRVRVGKFTIDKAYTLDEITNNKFDLTSVLDAFPSIKRIKVNDILYKKIKNGMILDKFFDDNMAFIIDDNNELIALYQNIDNQSRPYKMFI